MEIKGFLIAVMLLFVSAASVWAYKKAPFAKSLRKRAGQGDAESQSRLGYMYYQGQGVPQDYAEALKWYRLAAAQGYARAQYRLGYMYANGEGVPQDPVQAHKWLTLATITFTDKPERDEAIKARNRVAARMTLAQIAEAQKLAREWKKQ
jgi:TPR repeat protein